MFSKKELSSSVFLMALGLFLGFLSRRLLIWDSDSGPGPGFFPFCTAAIIVALSLLYMIMLLVRTLIENKGIAFEKGEEEAVDLFRVSSYTILIVIYAIVLEKIGFLIASALFLILIVRYVERKRWKTAMLMGLFSVIICYFGFRHLLGVPLPRGLINW